MVGAVEASPRKMCEDKEDVQSRRFLHLQAPLEAVEAEEDLGAAGEGRHRRERREPGEVGVLDRLVVPKLHPRGCPVAVSQHRAPTPAVRQASGEHSAARRRLRPRQPLRRPRRVALPPPH